MLDRTKIGLIQHVVEKYVLTICSSDERRISAGRTLLGMHRRKILYQQSRCSDDADGMFADERRSHVICGGSCWQPCFRFLRVLEFSVDWRRRVARFDAALFARRFVGQRFQRHANICQTTHCWSRRNRPNIDSTEPQAQTIHQAVVRDELWP